MRPYLTWLALAAVLIAGSAQADGLVIATPNGTSGSVPFFGASGTLTQNPLKFYWDNTARGFNIVGTNGVAAAGGVPNFSASNDAGKYVDMAISGTGAVGPSVAYFETDAPNGMQFYTDVNTIPFKFSPGFVDRLVISNTGAAVTGVLSATGHITFEGVTSTGATGSNLLVFATSPTLTTPNIGAATATTINGNTFTTGTYTLTGVAGKTLTFNNNLTLAGTDGVTSTLPATTGDIAASPGADPSPTTLTNNTNRTPSVTRPTLVTITINYNTLAAATARTCDVTNGAATAVAAVYMWNGSAVTAAQMVESYTTMVKKNTAYKINCSSATNLTLTAIESTL